jgi:hypothetical protein
MKLPGVEVTPEPASVASVFLVGRVLVTISLALAVTAHRLINQPKVRGRESKKDRLKPFNILLKSNHHCVGLPRRSSGTSSILQKALSC